MRALFGMVFGAGVLLFVTKKVQTGKPVTGLFYRRMLWLILFGLIHAHLILWIGDILYQYGICGMLVYLFRNVNPRYLEAVGQMAFTNYIMHSVICTLFFFGYGLNYYGELEFYQLYFVVLAIWMLQLVVSTLWLRYFNYGPLEWVWRSLTYWRRQPLRRAAPEQPT